PHPDHRFAPDPRRQGLRVFAEHLRHHQFEPDPPGTADDHRTNLPAGVPTAFTDSTSDNLWAGKVQLDWRVTDDWLLYAGINRGVKAGSFNAQLAGGLDVPTSAIPYKEEILWAYEAGFKSTWLGGTTRFNGSVFYYDYQDYQSFLFTGVGGVVINADATNVGMELELQTSPIEGLDIMLSGSWFNAEVKDVPLRVGGPITADVEPTYAPELQFAGLVRYEWPVFGGFASVQGDFSYSDEFYYNLRNFDADKFDSYTLVNALVGWRTDDGRWSGNLGVRNLTDERAGNQGFDLATLCGCNEVSYQPPRWYGLNLKYKF
ncbi:MAG: TonB-dependent receptor, partial [Gammaproteobacteria bacterium]|nr:TonB-dependent receptor [Gammaproteobacteria bacterium]